MSQINLDTSPYFDDFDAGKDFYKVLFKPGFPVQARELTTLQSILQNQISSFGEHFFKEGSMVIPGSITYNPKYDAVILSPQQGGIDISLYLEQLIGTTIRGETTGVKAKVVNYLLPPDEGVDNPTIFVSYSDSGTDEETTVFSSNEALINEQPVVYGNTTITAGSIFASTVTTEATAVGSAAKLSPGVYFVRGTFVQVEESTVILEPYVNIPSYRVGLQINESIVTAGQDSTLFDNAKGFNNFSAPGADRLKITATLTKKAINDTNDTNFVELLRVKFGEVKKLAEDSDYNYIKDYIAKRTYDESGDYVVDGLTVSVDESLNDQIGNGGVYNVDQLTDDNSEPNDDLAIAKVASGKAYVRGYDINNPGTRNLDAPKPRTTENVESTAIPFEMGSRYIVNNVSNSPTIGLNLNDNIVELYNYRLGSSGDQIGEARVYSFSLTDAPYEGNQTPWDLYLFDIQIFTKVTLNVDPSGKIGTFYRVTGESSGATAFVKSISGTDLLLSQVSGEFQNGEVLSYGTTETFTIRGVESYKPNEVRSVQQPASSFTADTRLYSRIPQSFVAADTFIFNGSTVTCPGRVFADFRIGDIILYQKAGQSDFSLNRVDAIAADQLSITVGAITDVPGVCDGSIPSGTLETTVRLTESQILNQDNSFLYAVMEEKNIVKADLANSNLIYTKKVENLAVDSAGTLTVNTSNLNVPDSSFIAFDQERYSVHYADGTVASLDQTQVNVASDGSRVEFTNLIPNSSGVDVIATAIKTSIKSKTKVNLRSQEFLVDKISSGAGQDNYGMSLNNFYGLRVDDAEISLNQPDVNNIVAVYESLDSGSPTLDTLGFVAGLQLDINVVAGEIVRGSVSGAVGRVVNAPTPESVRIVYLSQDKFEVGEEVRFLESSIITTLQQIQEGNYNDLTDRFTLDKGQREQFYDYSRLVRKRGVTAPTKKLLVIYDRFAVPANDKGDFYTASSYSAEVFGKYVPILNGGVRASDTLDFRPRVSPFTDTATSPFDFSSRKFGDVGSTTVLVTAPGESMVLGYDFYVGRRDRVLLDTLGQFKLVQGIAAKEPALPAVAEGAIELARIYFPPYLYDVSDAEIVNVDNKRYTMRDIGTLEDRIETLEEVTSLSLLERETESLQVLDADGNDRFKSGFFADDFSNTEFIDFENEDTQVDVATGPGNLISFNEFYTLPLRLQLKDGIDENAVSLDADIPLTDENTAKTGDLVTLDYDEVQWITQPLASRVENVNPFNVILYDGAINLTPRNDDFVITRQIGNRRIDVFGQSTGSFTRTFVESIEVAQFMRERNVAFASNAIKPHTRFYPFFEGSSGIDVIPKLIEIAMRTGTFQPGERVEGFNGNTRIFSARVCSPRHKAGDINTPTRQYTTNPYNREEQIAESYSASSTILNIDTISLADISDERFFGLVASGTRLVGRNSGAVATVRDVRLVSDTFGELFGAVFFRDPYATPAPAFRLRTGIRTFRLSSSPTNATPILGATTISFAETTYESRGTVANRRTEQVTIRDLPPPPPPVIIDQTVTNNFTEVIDRTVTNVIDRTRTVVNNINRIERRVVERVEIRDRPVNITEFDPLAQTFRVDETGAFLTSVDIFMATKSETDNLTVQIRPTDLATPTNFLLQDYAEVILSPDQVQVSEDGSVATNVVFPSPIYLEPEITYALVLLAPTTDDYTAWIARMGEENIAGANEAAGGAVIISQQYLNGSLFKSQNGSIWSPSQFEDLKFTLYKASFTDQSATVFLNNPPLGRQTPLANNPIRTLPRKIKTTISGTPTYSFNLGDKVVSVGSGNTDIKVSSNLEALGGPAASAVITTGGVGFIDDTYASIPTYAVNSEGNGLTLNVTTVGNTITSVSIDAVGTAYKVGDTVGLVTSAVGDSGGDAIITIDSIGDLDTLFLTNVSGESMVDTDSIKVVNPVTQALEETGLEAENSLVRGAMNRGDVFVLDLPVHGMESDTNFVEIVGILPDTVGSPLLEEVSVSSNTLLVDDVSLFTEFEGIEASIGYAYVGGEIIEYTDNGDGTLGITSRGVDNTAVNIHQQGDRVFKYEVSGVSLRRINRQHSLPNDGDLGFTRDIGSLPIKIVRSDRDTAELMLNFNQDQDVGGNSARSSQNFQYNRLLPSLGLLTPGSTTSIQASLRTVSGQSAGGNEESFLDQGFQPIDINDFNRFDTPRLVASLVNETNYLQDIPQNKSLTLALTFSSSDQNLSPVIDMSQANAVLARSALNKPISNYADDGRVNQVVGDPHSSIYISNKVDLTNPSTSLKILLSAYRDESADFRVLYRLYGPNTQGSTEPTWELFPGYNNMIDTDGDGFGDQIVDPSKNNGLPNKKVRASAFNEILEYSYEVDNLPEFSGFQVKIVMSGTNEARAPFFSDIRAIALA